MRSARPETDPGPTSLALLQPGTPAPDFHVVDRSGRSHTLEQYRGQPLILAFYPPDREPDPEAHVATYNELAARTGEPEPSLIALAAEGVWQELTFPGERVRPLWSPATTPSWRAGTARSPSLPSS